MVNITQRIEQQIAFNQLIIEHCFIILNNLKQFNKTPNMVEDIINLLPNTDLSLTLPFYNVAMDYYKQNNEFPSGRYFLSTSFANIFQINTKPYSSEIYNNVFKYLKLKDVTNKSIKELTEGNLENAISTLSGFSNIRSNKKSRLNPDLFWERYQQSKEKGIGLMTGVVEIDEILMGYDYGSLNVISAGPGCGKTSMAVSIVYNAVLNENKNFAFISLEVMDWHVYYSFIARHSRELGKPISARSMKKGKLTSQEEIWFKEVCEDFNNRTRDKLFIITQDDFITFNTASIEALIMELNMICKDREEQLDGFVFDYLQLTKYFKPPTIRDEKEVMNYYTRYLLELSTNFESRGLIGILLAQLNRTGAELLKKNKDASLFSFAEANELERSAHTAIVLHASDDMKLAGNVNFYIVKNRIGETKSSPSTVVADFPFFRFGTTTLCSLLIPDNDFMLDSDLIDKKQEDIQNQLNELESLLDI